MPSTRVSASALALTGAFLVAGCGNAAVSSSTSLHTLGQDMAGPAKTTAQQISDTGQGQLSVQDDGTKDHPCDGGHQRTYQATVVAPKESTDDEKTVRNRLSLVTQAGLKEAGAKVTTDLGSDASSVPATIDFASSPSDKADRRTYRTHVTVGSSTYTWRITGHTACVKD